MTTITSTLNYLTKRQGGLLTVIGLMVVLAIFGIAVSDRFSTISNATNILEQSTALALVSLGQTLVIITGGIDLSIGSMVSLASVLLSGITSGSTGMMWVAIAVVLALGILVGLINAGATIQLGVHPLIVTLGMGTILQGVTLLYTQAPIGKMPTSFGFLAYGRFLGIPVGALFTILLFAATAWFLHKVPFGRYIYAIPTDGLAAQLRALLRICLLRPYGLNRCNFPRRTARCRPALYRTEFYSHLNNASGCRRNTA
jgi:ribose transport system permease protein